MKTLYAKLQNKQDLYEDIRLHLQALLNSKAYCDHTSILAYGIPDFSQLVTNSHYTRTQLEAQIQHAIHQFEPRLQQARVEVLPTEEKDQLALIITAKIQRYQTDIQFLSVLTAKGNHYALRSFETIPV